MSTGAPRKHHTVSAGYVRRFAGRENTVTVHHLQQGVFDEGPRGVGHQLDYWGSPELASEVEELFCKVESDALRLLANLQAHWPLSNAEDRATLGQFLAIHIVRMPAFGGHLRKLGDESTREVLAENAPKYDLDQQQTAAIAQVFRSQRLHTDSLLRQIPRIASALCSMHWSVVEFEQDWLISCDQPVVLLPPVRSPISPASAIQPHGFMNTLEGRFPLDPRRALLLTWSDGPDEPWLSGERAHAASINCALKAQTLQEWFCRPGTAPPFCSPPILQERVFPLSLGLLPGYTVQSAAASRRRQATDSMMSRLVERQTPANEMHWVRAPNPKPAEPAADVKQRPNSPQDAHDIYGDTWVDRS